MCVVLVPGFVVADCTQYSLLTKLTIAVVKVWEPLTVIMLGLMEDKGDRLRGVLGMPSSWLRVAYLGRAEESWCPRNHSEHSLTNS